MAKCPNCGNDVAQSADGKYLCPNCGAQFSFEVPADGNDEIAQLKARIAALEAEKQTPPKSKNKAAKEKAASPALAWFKKNWFIPVIALLALIILVTLMTCFIGLRGVYYNVEHPNEFYSFTATAFERHNMSYGEDEIDRGTWHIKDGKLYLEYEDTSLGISIQAKEDLVFKKSNGYKTIMLGDSAQYMSEYKRISIVDYSVLTKKASVTFDANGGTVENSDKYVSTVKVGKQPVSPAEPTKPDREFKGWYTDPYGYQSSTSERYFGFSVWENVTYYANWYNPTQYSITLSGDGDGLILAREGDLLLPILQTMYPEYTFTLNGEIVTDTTRMPAEDVNIYVDNNLQKFQISLTGDISDTLLADVEDNVFDLLSSTYRGYEFYFNEQILDDEMIMPEGNIDIVCLKLYSLSLTGENFNTDFKIKANTNIIEFLKINFDEFFVYDYYIDDILLDESFLMPADPTEITCIKKNYTIKLIGDITASFKLKTYESVLQFLNDNYENYEYYFENNLIDFNFEMPSEDITIQCFKTYSVILSNDIVDLTLRFKKNDHILERLQILYSTKYDFYYDCIEIDNSFVMPEKDIALICIDKTQIYVDGSSYLVNIIGNVNLDNKDKPQGYFYLHENDLLLEYLNRDFYACKFTYNGQVIDESFHMPAKNILIKCELLENLDWEALEQVFTFEINWRGFSISCRNTDISGDIIIPEHYYGNKITKIGDFANCQNITSITIPETVDYIDNNAFEGCSGLTEITLPGNVTSIYRYTFKDCVNLNKINLPSTLEYIDDTAFVGCNNIKHAKIPASAQSVFTKDNLQTVEIYQIGDHTSILDFANCPKLTKVIIHEGIKYIGQRAFEECKNLSELSLPDSLTAIGWNAFYNCEKLENISIPDSVTDIGDSAFDLTAWYNNQPDATLLYIGKVAYGFKGYILDNASITIKQGTVGIAQRAFGFSHNLSSINIPSSVIYIGEEAFRGCNNLQSITVASGNTKYHVAGNCLIETESKTLIAGCNDIDIPADGSVTNIALYALTGKNFTEITIPKCITAIGRYAFDGCYNLTDIYYLGTRSEWDAIEKENNWNSEIENCTIHFAE